MKRKVDIKHRHCDILLKWKYKESLNSSQLLLNPGWPAFLSPSVAKLKWPDVSTWWLKPCFLMGWLWIHWILSYYSIFWCYFPSFLSLSGFSCFLGLASSSTDAVHAYRFIKSPSTTGQANLAPEECVQMLNPEGWNLLFSARSLIKPTALFQNISTQGTESLLWGIHMTFLYDTEFSAILFCLL